MAGQANRPITALLLGAAGYGGGELLRILHAHPAVGEVQAVSRSHAGQPWHAAHPRLRGFVEGEFLAKPDLDTLAASDYPVIFSAQPNGSLARDWSAFSAALADRELLSRTTVVDLSGDFRLGDAQAYQVAYGQPHPVPEALGQWVYGLSEHQAEALRGARRIANPGCFATAVQLALKPLLELASPDWLAITGVTGSSGSGVHPSATTHHPERADDFRAYKPLQHQHEAEIRRALAAQGGHALKLGFVPHSAPMVRGIFITVQAYLPGMDEESLRRHYQASYEGRRFIRLVDDLPRVHSVIGTNACDLGLAVRDGQVVVMAALDNLIKGMAGQAVQNMNLALGLDESSGLG
ncbi:N-acetyl-gamma-glutamyl-phosphate reductase [Natronospira sp.]|uniref:N-acetyl-gamma-glutamyl-phosphate reductase n=1 Tax=Natronospira sp. TaxID=2024970 RepID=UPI003873655D